MRGLFMIDRSIIEHHIVGIKNPKRFAAWIWMLSEAQWKPKKVWFNNAEINLERGELLVPLKIASAQVNMTIKQFRTFLSVLNRTGMVSKVGTPNGTPIGKGATVVSICNYDIYQDYEKYRAHQMAHQRAHQGQPKGNLRAHDLTPELPDETPELPEYNKSASADLLLREAKNPKDEKPKKARIPENWVPDEYDYNYALEKNLTEKEIEEMKDEFKAYWADRTDAGGRKSKRGWSQCWKSHVRRNANQYIRSRSMACKTYAGGFGQGSSVASAVARRHAQSQS